MNSFHLRFLALLCLAVAASTAAGQPDDVLVSSGDVSVTRADLEAELAELSSEDRSALLASEERFIRLLDKVFVYRALAGEARRSGLDRTGPVSRQVQLAVEAALGKARLAELRRTVQASMPDLLPLAREHYLANPDEYRVPEIVRASQLVIGTEGRSPLEASSLAELIYSLASSGEKSFEALAEEFSDEPLAAGKPRIYTFPRGKVGGKIEESVFGLHEPGALSAPVQSPGGYHVFRLESREPPRLQAFEEVRQDILAGLREQHLNQVVKEHLDAIRSGRDIETHLDAIRRFKSAYPVPVYPGLSGASDGG